MRKRFLLVIGILAATGADGDAQVPVDTGMRPSPYSKVIAEPGWSGFGLYAENDSFSTQTDQNYTGGFGINSGGDWIRRSHASAPLEWFNALFRVNRHYDGSDITLHDLGVLGAGYSPARPNLSDIAPVLDDRPYASIVALQIRRIDVGLPGDTSKPRRQYALTTELVLGALGLNAGKNVQSELHRYRRRRSGESTPVNPLGWHNQISNGGEPTFLYHIGLESLLLGAKDVHAGWQGQATWNVQGELGYYDNAAVGLSGRYGFMSTDFWQFNSNPTNTVNKGKGATPESRWELYGFFGARGRAVAYNALLQGQFRESAHIFTGNQIKRFIGEGEFGLALTMPLFCLGNVSLTWIDLAGRTPEFSGAKERAHGWGAVHLSYSARLPSPVK